MIDKNRYDLSLIASGKIEGSFAERMPDIHLIHLDTGFEKASISDVFRNTDMLATNRAGKNYNVQMKSRWSNKEDICFECCGYKGTIKENAIYGTYYSKKYKSYIWPNFKDMDIFSVYISSRDKTYNFLRFFLDVMFSKKEIWELADIRPAQARSGENKFLAYFPPDLFIRLYTNCVEHVTSGKLSPPPLPTEH